LQESEVADAKWLSLGDASDFIRSGHTQRGELATTFEFYDKLVQAVVAELYRAHATRT
jgi:hypothetical protein